MTSRFPVNVGRLDRTLRLIVGTILIVMVLTDHIGVWGWFGLFMIATALVRRCPIYVPLQMDTLEENHANRQNHDPRNRPH